MIDSIQTFGDSFLFGSELNDSDSITKFSKKTWPALIADRLNLNYECYAMGGVGNTNIAFNVLKYARQNCLVVINWSWVDRYDYFDTTQKHWDQTLSPHVDNNISKFYYQYIYSDLGAIFSSLIYIFSTHSWLKNKNIEFVSTFMDKNITNNDWTTPFIKELQDQLVNDLKTFPNNQTFLEWSRANGYPEGKGWHPLEQAHEEAANYWQPIYEKEISKHITTK